MPSIRPRAMFVSLALLVAASLTPLACAPAQDGEPGGTAETEILWDTRGVPHVFAATDEEVFHAHGWAQAKAHGDLVLRLYGESRGRAAEYWGAEHLESDRWVRTVGIPARAGDWLAAQSPRARAFLEAFVDGFNDYAAAHPERIADEVEPVLPVSAEDVLAHVQRAIHFTFMVNPRRVAALRSRWTSGNRQASARPAGPAAVPAAGSNAWALAPEHTASGNALLLANPHLPWSDLFTWFEIQLTGPSIDAYGAALAGTPFLGIAFNDHLGWTHTVNTLDGADFYELELADEGYLWDGAPRPFETEERTLRVRTEDGALRKETLTVRRSVHGPVVAESGGKALALRVAGLDQPELFDQYWEMATATDLEEFEAALRRLQMPMFTVMYADRDGHILHLFGGRVPKRPELPEGAAEDGWSWSGIVPGTGPETLWTETYGYDELPRVLDPESGWLQNANDPPWTTTFPRALDPEAFPEDMSPRGMGFRPQQSAELLAGLAEEPPASFEDFVRAKHSTEMELADRLLDDLAEAVEAHGDERARAAMDVLDTWDRTANADSRGGVLFRRFVQVLEGLSGPPFATPWNPESPRTTPDGLADPAGAVEALSRAAAELEELYGDPAVPWGEVYRLRGGGRDLPANGGDGGLGIFRVVGFRPAGEDGVYRAAGGDSYAAAIEFSDPVRARALLSYGNATQPGSPHVGDQLEPFANKELRPVWREPAEIEEHLEERETPGGSAESAEGN